MAASDIQLNITQGSSSVDVIIEDIEHSFDKLITDIPVPEQATPFTWLLDIKKLREGVKVVGWFEDTSSSSGLTKKNVLKTILQSNKAVTVTWGAGANEQTFVGSIMKSNIKEVKERRGNEGGSETKVFTVIIQFMVGVPIGG